MRPERFVPIQILKAEPGVFAVFNDGHGGTFESPIALWALCELRRLVGEDWITYGGMTEVKGMVVHSDSIDMPEESSNFVEYRYNMDGYK